MKITESKLRQIIREELRTLRLYSELEGPARDLANELTQLVHPRVRNANIDGGMGRVDWELNSGPRGNGPFKVVLKHDKNGELTFPELGRGATREEALETAIKNYPGVKQRLTGRLTFTKKP